MREGERTFGPGAMTAIDIDMSGVAGVDKACANIIRQHARKSGIGVGIAGAADENRWKRQWQTRIGQKIRINAGKLAHRLFRWRRHQKGAADAVDAARRRPERGKQAAQTVRDDHGIRPHGRHDRLELLHPDMTIRRIPAAVPQAEADAPSFRTAVGRETMAP